jgi:hypothetical protein
MSIEGRAKERERTVKVMIWSRAELFLLRSRAEKSQRQDRGGGCALPDSLRIDWQCIAPVLQYLSVPTITDLRNHF